MALKISGHQADTGVANALYRLRAMEKRQHPRVPIDRPVRLTLQDGSTVRARMVNISVEGIGIRYPGEATAGTALELDFTLLFNNETHSIHAEARVSHCYLHKQGSYTIGLQFSSIRKEQLKAIALFVEFKKTQRQDQPGFVVDYRNRYL
jgi:c-di-GMP-binding flagellar brake protein YcgR